MTTIELLNTLSVDQFTETLNEIFEHSPWIPRETFPKTPFNSWESLYSALCATVDAAPESLQMDLIKAHPDLAGKLAVTNQLTEHSTGEQQSARLDQLSPEKFQSMQAMNARYSEKFGFPFIICVKDHTQDSIFENFAARLGHDMSEEKFAALEQIKRIAWHRLHATVID